MRPAALAEETFPGVLPGPLSPGPLRVDEELAVDGVAQGGAEINDGHNKPGASRLGHAWAFGEGSTLPGFLPFLTIENPNPEPAEVRITYTPDEGQAVVRTVTAAPTSRLTVQVYGPAEQGGIGGEYVGFGILVEATAPVLVERPFYVHRELPDLGLINGGANVVGQPR